MALLVTREKVVTLMRNSLRISSLAAQRGFSSQNDPLTKGCKDTEKKKATELSSSSPYSTALAEPVQDVNVADVLHGVLHKSLLLIDVREPDELRKTGKIGKAINIPVKDIEKAFTMSYTDFEANYRTIKPSVMSERIVLYGRSEMQDVEAYKTLQELGYDKVKLYPGGIKEWNQLTLGDFEVSDEQLAK